MKHFLLFAILVCITVFQMNAANFTPEAGEKYYIVATGTGLVIGGVPSAQPNVNKAAKLASQRFEFIPVAEMADTYYIKNDSAYYLSKWSGNAWSTTYLTATDGASSEWVIDGADANNIRLKVNASGYIGYNSATDRPLWCDKNNTFATGVFKLIKVTDMIQNDLIDGGFENADADGTPIGVWVNDLGKTYGGGTSSRIQSSNGFESTGTNSFLLNLLGAADENSYNSISNFVTDLIPGATYQLSFNYKQAVSGAADATTRVFAAATANADYSQALGTVFTTTPPSDLTSAQAVSSGSITFVAPANRSCYLVFAKSTSSASYTQNIDDLVLSKTADPDPIITISESYLVFDELKTTGTFNVTGFSLADPITVTTPSGFSVDQSSLEATSTGAAVTVTYDGVTSSSSFITLTSGTAFAQVQVIAKKNTDCFSSLYPTKTNLFDEPFMNSLSTYGGWGSKAITNDTSVVYCGSSSVVLTGACGTSLDYNLTGKLTENTTYHFKAMMNANAELSFTLNGCGIDNTTSDFQVMVTGDGNWEEVDFMFTTGVLAANQNLWINSCSGSNRATLAYIDNMELYDISDLTNINAVVDRADQKVYVNNNQIIANLNLEQASKVDILVYNLQGVVLSKENTSLEAGNHSMILQSVLPAGAYLVNITSNGISTTHKIIK